MTSLFIRNRARPPCRGTTAARISIVAIGLGWVVGLLVRYSRILWTIVRFCAVYGCINRSNNEIDKRFFIIPAIYNTFWSKDRRAEKGRRDKWLSVIKKQDLTEDKIRLAAVQGRRHGFLSGVRIVGRVANLPQNILKIGKKHRILATSFSNLGGSHDPIFKSAGVRTPRPPRRRRPCSCVHWSLH